MLALAILCWSRALTGENAVCMLGILFSVHISITEYTYAMPKLRAYILPGLFTFALGAVVGVTVPYALPLALVVASIGLYVLYRALRGRFALTSILAIGILCIALGILRGSVTLDGLMCTELCASIDKAVTVEGVVIAEPALRDGVQRVTLRSVRDARDHLLATLPSRPQVSYGDLIRVRGVLRAPKDFETDGGGQFRYVDFLHARGNTLLLSGRSVEIMGKTKSGVFIRALFAFKQKIKEVCDRLPSPEGSLLMGMIFGGKDGLPQSVQDDFRVAGLIHIVVLSGENLTIIALLITFFVRKFLGFVSGILASGVIVSAYALLGGMEPATMRALFIVLLVFAGVLIRREANIPRILMIGGLLLLIMNPLLLLDDPSFQLSMLAMLGLLYIGPVIERMLLLRGVPLWLTTYIAPIFGAQLGVLPFVIWMSQSFALYALLANILVLFFIGFLSAYGIILVFVGMLLPSLFTLLALPAEWTLALVLFLAHAFAQLPFASIPLALPGWLIAVAYAGVVYYLYGVWRSGTLSPLAQFTLREEVKLLAKRKIPWIPPEGDSHEIRFDTMSFTFSAPSTLRTPLEQEAVIDWST